MKAFIQRICKNRLIYEAAGLSFRAAVLMVDLQIGAACAGNNRICTFFLAFGLTLDFGYGRSFIAGLCVRPIRTGHSFFGH